MKQFTPYELRTFSGAVTAIDCSDSWIGRIGKNLAGLMVEVTMNITNTDAVNPHNYDRREFAIGALVDLRAKGYGVLASGANLRGINQIAVLTKAQPDADVNGNNLVTAIPAAATVAITAVYSIPLTDLRLDTGYDGVIPSVAFQDYRFRGDCLAGQTDIANLALAGAGWTVRILAAEVTGDPIFGSPIAYIDKAITDTNENLRFDGQLTDAVLYGPPASVAATLASPFTFRIGSDILLDNADAVDASVMAAVPSDPDFRVALQAALVLKSMGAAYSLSDLPADKTATIEKRDGVYAANMRLIATVRREHTDIVSNMILGAGAQNHKIVVAIGKTGTLAPLSEVLAENRRQLPKMLINAAEFEKIQRKAAIKA